MVLPHDTQNNSAMTDMTQGDMLWDPDVSHS